MSSKLLSFVFCFLYALLNVTGAAMIKWHLKNKRLLVFSDWIKFIFNYEIIVAFFIIFLSALVLFKSLSTSDFSFVIPVANGINFSLTILIGYFFFKDQINYISLIGFFLILSGIFLLSLNNMNHVQ